MRKISSLIDLFRNCVMSAVFRLSFGMGLNLSAFSCNCADVALKSMEPVPGLADSTGSVAVEVMESEFLFIYDLVFVGPRCIANT